MIRTAHNIDYQAAFLWCMGKPIAKTLNMASHTLNGPVQTSGFSGLSLMTGGKLLNSRTFALCLTGSDLLRWPARLSSHYTGMYRTALPILGLLLIVGCESNTADVRLRKYLNIDAATPLTEIEIRTAALRLMPLGSDEDQVEKIIAAAGIGGDGLSYYDPPRDDGRAHIGIRLDPGTFGLVKREYSLILQFNHEHRLQDIGVRTWLTGL